MIAGSARGALIYRIYNKGEILALADGWRSDIALYPGRKWIIVIFRSFPAATASPCRHICPTGA